MFWCLQLFFHVLLQFLTSLKLGHYSKLIWPKRVSAVYWFFGTLFYPCSTCLNNSMVYTGCPKKNVTQQFGCVSFLSSLVLMHQCVFMTSTPNFNLANMKRGIEFYFASLLKGFQRNFEYSVKLLIQLSCTLFIKLLLNRMRLVTKINIQNRCTHYSLP